ncbi:Myc-type, basic helix-loop-helix [Sesbania bispinosa]|nr:Myc-type, basic helix-loop-helix [Sesbania bispinosa]
MGHVYEDRLYVSLDELCFNAENGSNRGRMGRKNYDDDTRMNKATIIDDAITYIQQLQDEVQNLSQELHEMEATTEEIEEPKIVEFDAAEEMKKWGIQEEIEVTRMDGNKLWVKMIIENKRGRFNKLMETMHTFGIELIHTNVTTMKGAFLITTCIQGMNGETLEVDKIKQLIPDIIRVI